MNVFFPNHQVWKKCMQFSIQNILGFGHLWPINSINYQRYGGQYVQWFISPPIYIKSNFYVTASCSIIRSIAYHAWILYTYKRISIGKVHKWWLNLGCVGRFKITSKNRRSRVKIVRHGKTTKFHSRTHLRYITHQLTSKQSRLMDYWKWSQFWVKWGLRNCVFKMNGL